MTPNRPVLLTGASGQIGRACTRHLLDREYTVYSLTRTGFTPEPGVFALRGDICRADLGLTSATRRRLSDEIGSIIHCAASTKFVQPLSDARVVNVDGTRYLLEFAETCSRLNSFVHCSTAYIAGSRPGLLAEEPAPFGHSYFNAYEQSKHEAESLVFERNTRFKTSVVRISTAVGNSQTGLPAKINYFHQLVRLALRNPLPVIPANPEAQVDFVADEWVAAGLDEIRQHPSNETRVWHLCSGPQESLRVREVLDLIYSRVQVHRPEAVGGAEFLDFAASLEQRGHKRQAALAHMIASYLPHLTVRQGFAVEQTHRSLQRAGIELPPVRAYLPAVIARILT